MNRIRSGALLALTCLGVTGCSRSSATAEAAGSPGATASRIAAKVDGASISWEEMDKRAAEHTLYEVLTTLTRLSAPYMPFLSEAMFQNLERARNHFLILIPVTLLLIFGLLMLTFRSYKAALLLLLLPGCFLRAQGGYQTTLPGVDPGSS